MLRVKHLSLTGFTVASILFVESIKPVLLPLNIKSQIIFSGIVVAIGYDIGLILKVAILKLGFAQNYIKNTVRYILIILISIVTCFLTWFYLASTHTHYASLGVISTTPNWLEVVLGSTVIGFLILQLAILVRSFGKFCDKRIKKPRIRIFTYSSVLILTTGLGYLLLTLSIFILQVSLDVSSRSKTIEQHPVSSAFKSSGTNSIISWEGLGQKGKEFVSSQGILSSIGLNFGPQKVEQDPVRIYAGIGNEIDLEKRIDLIMQEFERTKAFEKSTVVMYTPSGSGWVNPVAVESVEYITNGNSASVSLQYSDNQAVLQYIKDPKIPGKASTLLFSKIRHRLDSIPKDKRPKLYVYGESLGSLGSQEIFNNTSLSKIGDLIDGALWVGSPSSGPLWKKVAARQDSLAANPLVRITSNAKDLKNDSGIWGPVRIAFLYNATDPIVWSDPKVIYEPPGWLKQPRPQEISRDANYLPVLTFGHMWFELFGAKNLPSGIGHNYDQEIPCALANVMQASVEKFCQ